MEEKRKAMNEVNEVELHMKSMDDSRGHVTGFIFMCNKQSMEECFNNGIFGLPFNSWSLVSQIVPGTILFLFEYESRQMRGIYEAVSHGKLNIIKHAFSRGSFPAQVRFKEIESCPPLGEEEFKDAIRESYYSDMKFKFELHYDQVYRLCSAFLWKRAYEGSKADSNLQTPVNASLESEQYHNSLYSDKMNFKPSVWDRLSGCALGNQTVANGISDTNSVLSDAEDGSQGRSNYSSAQYEDVHKDVQSACIKESVLANFRERDYTEDRLLANFRRRRTTLKQDNASQPHANETVKRRRLSRPDFSKDFQTNKENGYVLDTFQCSPGHELDESMGPFNLFSKTKVCTKQEVVSKIQLDNELLSLKLAPSFSECLGYVAHVSEDVTFEIGVEPVLGTVEDASMEDFSGPTHKFDILWDTNTSRLCSSELKNSADMNLDLNNPITENWV